MRRKLLAAAVILILVAGFILVRVALNPEAIRSAAEARLSAMLGQPVRIGRVSASMFPTPAVLGGDISIGPDPERAELTLEGIRIVPHLRSLISGPYTIREVALVGLSLRIVREADGQWRFPSVVPAPGGDSDGGVVVERVRLTGGRIRVYEESRDGLRETSRIGDVAAEAVAEGSALRISPLTGSIGGSAVSAQVTVNPSEVQATFTLPEIRGEDLPVVLGLAATEPPPFVTLTEPAAVDMSVVFDRKSGRLKGTGKLRAPRVRFYSLQLSRLEAPIVTDGVKLTFNPATFALYGGTQRGSLVVDLSGAVARWTLDSQVSTLDVGDFLGDLTGHSQQVDGTGTGSARVGGRVGDAMPAALAGQSRVTISDGVIRGFPLLAAINRALRLAEGDSKDTRFESLSATFRFAGAAETDDLVLVAREMRVEAAGRIGYDGALAMRGVAALSPERTERAIRSVRELTGLRNDRGELEVPLAIGGSIDAPSFGVDLKAAVGKSIKEELRRRIRSLFRRD